MAIGFAVLRYRLYDNCETTPTSTRSLHDHLVGVVAETMHPAHVSLWLRSETTSK